MDSKDISYTKTVWQEIFDNLEEEGLEVYSPGIKLGECKRPYFVVMEDTGSRHPEFSTDVDLYSVLCYVPAKQYSLLGKELLKLKIAMKKLEPMVKANGYKSPSFQDDELSAHMVSVQYKNHKKAL